MKLNKIAAWLAVAGLVFSFVAFSNAAPAGACPPPPPPPPTICGEAEVFTLWGGKTINVGTVTVSNDEENLYVTYDTTGDWYLKEVHLYVLDYEPTERLTPGQAPYKSGDISYATSYTFVVPLAGFDVTCDETVLWLQAHAAVVKIVDGEVVEGETAYGGDITKPKKGSWYGNIKYTVQCCEEEPPCECQEETAWGGKTAGGGTSWWYYYDAEVGGVQTIWAGQHINVGTVEVVEGTVYITLTGGWELQDVKEPVKIQGYNEIPASRPAAGLFTHYKGDALTVYIGEYAYYAIHLDVQLCPTSCK
jgi:hypothetical protein